MNILVTLLVLLKKKKIAAASPATMSASEIVLDKRDYHKKEKNCTILDTVSLKVLNYTAEFTF